jgi:sulfite reductase beta subunit-like hemoprotein
MGTNYYIRTPGCENGCSHCTEAELIHLGKSSAGWRFGFYIPPDCPREAAYEAWTVRLEAHLRLGGHIEDEYGVRVTKEELLDLIESKQHLRSHLNPLPDERRSWRERGMSDLYRSLMKSHFLSDGYDFSDREFS